MEDNYLFEYENENEFKKYENTLKKYNMLAYKKLYFNYYPAFKEGKFFGKVIYQNKKRNIKKFELSLPTNEMFLKIHGNITIQYTVYFEDKVIIFDKITPQSILNDAYQLDLKIYKGVLVSPKQQEKDMFKINLLKTIEKL